MKASSLQRVFDEMYIELGGDSNPDIEVYRQRSAIVTRDSFFRELVWAIWVSGKSRRSAGQFLARAEKAGFTYDFRNIASWTEEQRGDFVTRLHGWHTGRGRPMRRPVPRGAVSRWDSIIRTAEDLAEYSTEQEFRDEMFRGKVSSASLDGSDVARLQRRKIPYVGEANAHFIVKNMGGEEIKADRWIQQFLKHYAISVSELAHLLDACDIRRGLFDTVLWSYCEEFVVSTADFSAHFSHRSDRE